jgi:spermidine/putrescine transport system ATP-binding protein
MVTHDQDEALAMACRCAVMHRGLLQQVATPSDLYEFPASRFVADFVGQVNLFEGRLAIDAPGHAVVTVPDLALPVWLDHGVTGGQGTTLWLALRPEKIELHKRGAAQALAPLDDAPAGHNHAAGVIRHIQYLGSESTYDVELASGRMVKALRSNLTRWDQEDFAIGEPVWLAWHACSPAVLLS